MGSKLKGLPPTDDISLFSFSGKVGGGGRKSQKCMQAMRYSKCSLLDFYFNWLSIGLFWVSI